jgi:hypothetical protein
MCNIKFTQRVALLPWEKYLQLKSARWGIPELRNSVKFEGEN